MEAGHAIEQGIRNVLPETKVLVKPLADGGEGTTESLAAIWYRCRYMGRWRHR